MYRWIYILASRDEAKNFVYHATLKGQSEKESSFCGQVKSLDESFEEVLAGQVDMFVVTSKTAIMFRNEDGSLNFQIKLRSFKEEAKDDNEESGISDNDEKDE